MWHSLLQIHDVFSLRCGSWSNVGFFWHIKEVVILCIIFCCCTLASRVAMREGISQRRFFFVKPSLFLLLVNCRKVPILSSAIVVCRPVYISELLRSCRVPQGRTKHNSPERFDWREVRHKSCTSWCAVRGKFQICYVFSTTGLSGHVQNPFVCQNWRGISVAGLRLSVMRHVFYLCFWWFFTGRVFAGFP